MKKTIKNLLNWGQQALSSKKEYLDPQQNSELILSFILKKDLTYLYAHPEKKVNCWQRARFYHYIKKRRKLYPLAYIRGYTYFYDLKIKILKNVFIPRPESEILIQKVLKYIKDLPQKQINIAEIGGGSGALATALLKNSSKITKYHINDISKQARKNIKINAKNQDILDKIKIYSEKNFSPFKNLKTLDILITNPPYVPYKKYLQSPTIKYEPLQAITDKKDGCSFYKKLFKDLKANNSQIPFIIMEIDENNTQKIKELYKKYLSNLSYSFTCIKDLQNLDRFIILKN